MQGSITLTSRMGRFVFPMGHRLVDMKLIRDSITGQFFKPLQMEMKIKTAQDAQTYALHHLDRNLAAIDFEVLIDVEKG